MDSESLVSYAVKPNRLGSWSKNAAIAINIPGIPTTKKVACQGLK